MTEDYISAHLAWIRSHRTFTPRYAHDYTESYEDIMKQLYQNPYFRLNPDLAKKLWASDIAWQRRAIVLANGMNNEVSKIIPNNYGLWFVTIGFNHQTWTVTDCCKIIEKILGMDWIISAKANFELFRENGEHPHVHFIIKTEEPKSRILDKLFRPLYVKKVVLSKSFIDVKPMSDYHLKYIELDKQTAKQEFVDKDKEWRLKNKIPDYEKNWGTI